MAIIAEFTIATNGGKYLKGPVVREGACTLMSEAQHIRLAAVKAVYDAAMAVALTATDGCAFDHGCGDPFRKAV